MRRLRWSTRGPPDVARRSASTLERQKGYSEITVADRSSIVDLQRPKGASIQLEAMIRHCVELRNAASSGFPANSVQTSLNRERRRSAGGPTPFNCRGYQTGAY